jgi:hypothetical protein
MKTWPALVIIGSCVYLYGASALAISGAPPVVDLSAWIQIISGLVIALVGAYAKGLSERIAKAESKLDVLQQALSLTQVNIAAEHHTKEEANAQFAELKATINALHRRFDFFRLPPGMGE